MRWCLAALSIVFLGATSAAAAGPFSGNASNPTWSRDGTRIAYTYASETLGQLAVMNAAGSGKRLLFTADDCCEPVLWATGNRIAFISNFDLFTVGALGGKPTERYAAGDAQWFLLSPNGETAAIDIHGGKAAGSIAIVDIRGTSKPYVIPRPKNASDSVDDFSPDGTQLVFTRGPYSPDGGPVRRGPQILVENLHLRGSPVPLAQSGLIGSALVPANASWPQWSPDGKWVLWRQDPKTLWLASTTGGAPTRLSSTLDGASSFSWSPTSTRIAATAYGNQGDTGMLSTLDLQGHETLVSGKVNWVSNDSWDRPQWSPDGSKLVFMARNGDGIWVVGADGAGLKQLARSS